MSNDEIVNKRNQVIKEANGVYNQIINEQTDLVNSQSNQIDNYMNNSKETINQNINKNVNEIQNASEKAKREQEAEKQAIMNNYNNYTKKADETTRIGALNSVRNRINESNSSLNDVIQEYNNQISQAKITGQSIIAQNALEMLKEKLTLFTTGTEMNNNMLLANNSNNLQLTKDYATLDNQYSSANNDYLDRQNEINQFNTEMKYKDQQLNEQKKLKEQEYQLALKEAKQSYYSSKSSSGGSSGSSGSSNGGYVLTDTSTSNNGTTNNTQTTNNTNSTNSSSTYYCNYTPVGLTKTGTKVFNNLSSKVNKTGSVTLLELESAVKGLSKNDQGLILKAFKAGKTNPVSKINKKNTQGYNAFSGGQKSYK